MRNSWSGHRAVAVAVVFLSIAACSWSRDQITYTTYEDPGGNVWIKSDCPNTDQLLTGEGGDGLPHKSSTADRVAIEEWLGNGGRSSVVPRNGDVWERTPDGVVITRANDYMIETTIDDASQCPGSGAFFNNGVPVAYRIER